MSVDQTLVETCTAPSNIACIKYWGKDSVELNTPINSSVSVTLDQKDLRAVTTVCASKDFPADRLWLNGSEEPLTDRFHTVLAKIRELAGDRVVGGRTVVGRDEWPAYKVHVVSVNTFPTAAGLASSAAGYACLVYSLAQLFAVEESYEGELSAIARQGSGSACRSLYGGFVRWQKGERADALDSKAVQVADENHWPEMKAVVLVASAAKKKVSSTAGMGTTVATSALIAHRAAEVVPPRVVAIEEAYIARDFETFGRLTMQESNQFHATCLDTFPPIFYLNDVSRDVIRAVHALNEQAGKCIAAYTFDAGPNAVIYCLEPNKRAILANLLAVFPPGPGATTDSAFSNDLPFINDCLAMGPTAEAFESCLASSATLPRAPGDISMVLSTGCGPGPQKLGSEAEVSLVDSHGLPKADAVDIAFGVVGERLGALARL